MSRKRRVIRESTVTRNRDDGADKTRGATLGLVLMIASYRSEP